MNTPEKAKRDEDRALWFPWVRMLLALAGSVVICGAIIALVANQVQQQMREALGIAVTPNPALDLELTESMMGARLPASVSNLTYEALGFLEAINYITIRFSIPPQDYATFIAAAKPTSEYVKCVIVPLQPEGKQPEKPDCYSLGMEIIIDKSNAELWRVTIDMR